MMTECLSLLHSYYHVCTGSHVLSREPSFRELGLWSWIYSSSSPSVPGQFASLLGKWSDWTGHVVISNSDGSQSFMFFTVRRQLQPFFLESTGSEKSKPNLTPLDVTSNGLQPSFLHPITQRFWKWVPLVKHINLILGVE